MRKRHNLLLKDEAFTDENCPQQFDYLKPSLKRAPVYPLQRHGKLYDKEYEIINLRSKYLIGVYGGREREEHEIPIFE